VFDCGSVPRELIESMLFGHVKGSFTGAITDRRGAFAEAHGGTIFLDEIGEMALDLQPSLLRVLDKRAVRKVGSNTYEKIDVRVVAATNRDLRAEVAKKAFREDLYYRLAVVELVVPPLRDRKDDIPLLTQHFLNKYGEENRKTGLDLAPEAIDLISEYDWPGNVRELENVIERAVVLTSGTKIGADLVPEHVRKPTTQQLPPQFVVPPEGISFKDVTTDFEKRLIESTLEVAGGVQKRAAELLHIKPTTLNEMIKRHDIRPRRKRGGPGTPADDGSEPEPTGEIAGPIGRS
jgi:two-component system response regulator PilR (NtrC family)